MTDGPDDLRLEVAVAAPPPYAEFVRRFQRHANSLAMLFGGPVYLVGGALVATDPRDHDVRVVIDERDRVRRFGPRGELANGQWDRATWLLKAEGLKQSRRLSEHFSCYRIDFQIQLDVDAARYGTAPRFRLDAAPDDLLAWPGPA